MAATSRPGVTDDTATVGAIAIEPDTEPDSEPDSELDPRVARSRAKVLEAATALLVEGGPRAVTVDAVTERCGVAKSTPYRHWPSRSALLIDVFRSNIPPTEHVDLTAGFERALRTNIANVADSFCDPKWSKMLPALFMLKQQLSEVEELSDDDRDEKMSVLSGILDVGVAEGRIPAGLDPTTVAATLVGPMIFAIVIGEGDVEELGRFAVDRFLDSFASTD